jgi:hypothetical protein
MVMGCALSGVQFAVIEGFIGSLNGFFPSKATQLGLVRLAVAIKTKLTLISDRKILCPRVCRSLLYHVTCGVWVSAVLNPVQNNVAYRSLTNCRLITGLKIDGGGYTYKS